MKKWIERIGCIFIGVCISILIIGLKEVNRHNLKDKSTRKNSQYILQDIQKVLEGDNKNIDERIKSYVKRHKKSGKYVLTERELKEALGEGYDVIKENDVDRVASEIITDNINDIYKAQYTLKVKDELYKLDIEVKLDEENNIEEIEHGDFIQLSQ